MALSEKKKPAQAETIEECKARIEAAVDACEDPVCEVAVPYEMGEELRAWVKAAGLRVGLNLGKREAPALLVIAWTLSPPEVTDGPA